MHEMMMLALEGDLCVIDEMIALEGMQIYTSLGGGHL